MKQEQVDILSKVLDLIGEGKITPIETERMLNSMTRLDAGVPTGQQNDKEKK